MKNRVLPLLLALVLVLSLAPAMAAGAVEDPYDYELEFTDVTDDDTFYEAVVWAVQEGVTSGTSDDAFSPGQTCTRGQVVTFLWRAKGCPEPKSEFNPFKDVAPDSYYATAVLWAVENAVTAGTTEETFSPDDPCTWAHILTFLWRANGKPEPAADGITSGWPQSWYRSAVAWADTTGILGIDREGFDPERPCSRGTTVTWLFNDAVKTVSTTAELMGAIATGRIIYVEEGEYNLSAWAETVEPPYPLGNNVAVLDAVDGREIHVENVALLRLRAAPGAEGKVKLLASPRYAQVMTFEDCGILEFKGLILGHTDGATCQGGVLMFRNCDSVWMQDMDLYGCGIYGIETHDVERLTVRDTVIHDCSYGIMQLYDTVYAEFDDCTFRNCKEYDLLTVWHSAAFFNDCEFRDNTWGDYGSFLSCSDDDQTIVVFSDCTLDAAALQALRELAAREKHVAGDWQ